MAERRIESAEPSPPISARFELRRDERRGERRALRLIEVGRAHARAIEAQVLDEWRLARRQVEPRVHAGEEAAEPRGVEEEVGVAAADGEAVAERERGRAVGPRVARDEFEPQLRHRRRRLGDAAP